MEPKEKKETGLKEKVFLWSYICILVTGIICLATVPAKYENFRLVSGFFVYGTGFPLVVISLLVYSQKKGWLKKQ
jgi:hypothetical protein